VDVQNEIKFAFGLFYFFVSFSPGSFLKVLELLGFVSNRELGIQYMHEIVDTQAFKEPNAALFLLLNYLIIPRGLSKKEDNLIAAEKILMKCLERYPNGSTYLLFAGQFEVKRGNLSQARQYIEKAIDSLKDIPVVPFMYLTNLAFVHLMARDWSKAIEVLEKVINNDTEFEMKGLCGIQLATCYYMVNQKDKCDALMERIPSLISKHSRFDKLAERKLAQFKKRGISLAPFEFLYVRRDLHHLNEDDLKPTLELLEKHYKDTVETVETKAVFLLLKGAILHGLHEKENARSCFKEVTSMAKVIKEEIWVLPNAFQELGEILYFEGNLDKAEEMFKNASRYNNYDWQEVVANRIKLSLDRIQKEKQDQKRKSKT